MRKDRIVSMNSSALRLLFPDAHSAQGAFETLQELGYCPEVIESCERPELSIHIVNHDVLSALEITHAYGGQLAETAEHHAGMYASETGVIGIPAHIVNEDFTDGYAMDPTGRE